MVIKMHWSPASWFATLLALMPSIFSGHEHGNPRRLWRGRKQAIADPWTEASEAVTLHR